MKTKFIKSYVAVALLAIAGLNSCQKENIDPVNNAKAQLTSQANEHSYMSALSYKVTMMAFGAGSGNMDAFKNESAESILASCAIVTKDTMASPHTIRMEFPFGCKLSDGTPVEGVVKGTFTDNAFGKIVGSQATLDFDSFIVNGNRVIGLLTLENMGPNGNGNTEFDMTMSNGSLKYGSDGRTIKHNVQWVMEWITNGTNSPDDDFISATGTADGVTSDGDAYTETITTPLVLSRDPNCVRQFISGVTLAQIVSKPDLTIDYGTGACDIEADATQGGTTVTITLSKF